MNMCKHEKFEASVNVQGQVGPNFTDENRFNAEINIICAQCKVPFIFTDVATLHKVSHFRDRLTVNVRPAT